MEHTTSLNWLLCVAIPLLLSAPAVALAEGGEDALRHSASPYFFIDDGDPAVDRLPLERTSARVDVTGVIANVRVEQVYRNQGSRPITARYVFPASIRAAVHGMRMRVAGQTIEAVVQERKQAKETFETARRAGKSASLLEQQRPNVFTMQVANVMPGDRIEVQLDYTELLVPEDGVYELVYPTVVGPRYPGGGAEPSPAPAATAVSAPYTVEAEQATYGFHIEGRIETGVPLQSLEVMSHRVVLERGSTRTASFSLAPDERHGGDRDFILRYALRGQRISSGLMLYDGAEEGAGPAEKFFLLTVEPPERVLPEAIPPREYVFVLDVSGSMFGFPLDTAKQLIRDLTGTLRPIDRFNVLLFSGGSRVLWPASRPGTDENVSEALAVVDRQDGGGGTELMSALSRALSMPTAGVMSRHFVVVTDGYIAAERDVFQYVREHAGDANVHAFGIGTGVNRHLLDGLARAGLGEAFVVTDPAESRATASRFARYVKAPVLTDLSLHADGFDIHDVQPRALPDLLAERPIVVMGKWRGEPTGTLAITGVTGEGRYRSEVIVSKSEPDPANQVLERLWARTRIADVSELSFGQETEAERALVTALGLRYNLLTAHTSFVAVASQVRNQSGQSDDVSQPLPLPVGVSDAAVAEPMYGAPEPELWWLLVMLALMVFTATVRGSATRGASPERPTAAGDR